MIWKIDKERDGEGENKQREGEVNRNFEQMDHLAQGGPASLPLVKEMNKLDRDFNRESREP